MTGRILTIVVGALLTAGAAHADTAWDGKVRMGGVWLDETGDASTMPEVYDIYDGFMLSSIYLNGVMDERMRLRLDLTDFNQDNRRGSLDLRRTGMLHFRSRYNESRWVFDPMGTDASRKNWFNSLSYTPRKYLWFSADYNLQTREGDRRDLNPGYEGWLGTEYDTKLHRYRLEAQARSNYGIGGMLAYDGVMQRDALNTSLERDGYVLSANVHSPCYLVKSLTHVLRGAIGHNEIRETGVGFDMMNFQYTGVWQALHWFRLRYRGYASEVEDDATTLQTNNYQNDVDGTFSYSIATLMLGYGWEALDDDRAVTTTNKFRGALSLRDPGNRVRTRVVFDGSEKDDEENSTLLRDSETQRLDVRVDANPIQKVTLGGRYSQREREYPDIDTEAEGIVVTGYAAWREPTVAKDFFFTVTELGAEYTYGDDDYDNLYGSEHIVSHVVTGRVRATVWDDLDLIGSFTYLELEEDLDVEKSIFSVGAAYRLPRGFTADVKYNAYNYDDFLLSERMYTANVVWVNVGYEFSVK